MLKKTITYTDYNNETRTEDFLFNLNKAELVEMNMETPGGLSDKLKDIVAAKDDASLFKFFKELVLRAYGVKSSDGKRFMKSEELRTEFAQTEAYSDLFMELASDADAAIKFITGIIPADLAEKVDTANVTELPL